MENRSPFPKPPYWYTEESLVIPEIPETVMAFGQVVSTDYKELKLQDFNVPVKHTTGSKQELKRLLKELYKIVLDLFSNLSHDTIYAKQNAQDMLILMQNIHYIINMKYVKYQAKIDLSTLHKYMEQKIKEYELIFKSVELL